MNEDPVRPDPEIPAVDDDPEVAVVDETIFDPFADPGHMLDPAAARMLGAEDAAMVAPESVEMVEPAKADMVDPASARTVETPVHPPAEPAPGQP